MEKSTRSRNPKAKEARGGSKELLTKVSALCPHKILQRLIYAHDKPIIDPLPKNQAWFRCEKSTVDQVVILTQNLEDSFKAKIKADVLYVDLTVAYNTVCHRVLNYTLLRFLLIKHMTRIIMEIV